VLRSKAPSAVKAVPSGGRDRFNTFRAVGQGAATSEETNMAWIAEQSLPTASSGLAAAVCDAPASESGMWVYAVGG